MITTTSCKFENSALCIIDYSSSSWRHEWEALLPSLCRWFLKYPWPDSISLSAFVVILQWYFAWSYIISRRFLFINLLPLRGQHISRNYTCHHKYDWCGRTPYDAPKLYPVQPLSIPTAHISLLWSISAELSHYLLGLVSWVESYSQVFYRALSPN